MIETRPIETPLPAKTTADVLRHAALLIEERGWCRADRQSPDGQLCIVGAIELAQFGSVHELGDIDGVPSEQIDPFALPGAMAVEKYLGLEARGTWGWNDAPGRTAAEVIAALRAAADSA